MITIHCKGCGIGYPSKGGESRSDYLLRMASMGFTLAPAMLCRGCSCPMDYYEKAMSKNLSLLGTSAQMAAFRASMRRKYGPTKQIDKWFDFL